MYEKGVNERDKCAKIILVIRRRKNKRAWRTQQNNCKSWRSSVEGIRPFSVQSESGVVRLSFFPKLRKFLSGKCMQTDESPWNCQLIDSMMRWQSSSRENCQTRFSISKKLGCQGGLCWKNNWRHIFIV